MSTSDFCSNVGLLARSTSSVCLHSAFLRLVRPIVVVRKGWSAVAAPDGWYEVIRGPRPPSAQWTFQPPQGPDKVIFQEGRRGRWRSPSRRPAKARVSPDEGHEVACARVKQLQNAINALDEKDPFVASLRAEFTSRPCRRPCQAHHSIPREGTEARVGGQEELEAAQKDIRDGEARLERLQEESSQDVSPPTVTGPSTNAELERLRGFGGGTDPGQFREEVCQSCCSFRSSPGHQCRVGGSPQRARHVAGIVASVPDRQQCQKEARMHIGHFFSQLGPCEFNSREFVHFNSSGFGASTETGPFLHGGVFDPLMPFFCPGVVSCVPTAICLFCPVCRLPLPVSWGSPESQGSQGPEGGALKGGFSKSGAEGWKFRPRCPVRLGIAAALCQCSSELRSSRCSSRFGQAFRTVHDVGGARAPL